jgi:predicted nicotinamide N-methyase
MTKKQLAQDLVKILITSILSAGVALMVISMTRSDVEKSDLNETIESKADKSELVCIRSEFKEADEQIVKDFKAADQIIRDDIDATYDNLIKHIDRYHMDVIKMIDLANK